MDMSRHQFLAALHELLQPQTYLEIGVQYGDSLVLAEKALSAVGVDPSPLLFAAPQNQLPNQFIFSMTSDEFFEKRGFVLDPVDLAFIDGSHLAEDTMADFANVQRHMRPGGVIVFDDVLPYSQGIAAREQPPGDWTGDVWKCFYIIDEMYEMGHLDERPILVDTSPTGTMVLLNVEPKLSLPAKFMDKKAMYDWFGDTEIVPESILSRTHAVHPDVVLDKIREKRAQ